MTIEELLQDLKAYVANTVGQSEQRLRDEIAQAQKQTGDLVAQAVDDLGALIETDKAETKQRLDEHGDRLNDHGRRIQRLERRAA